MKEGSYSVKDIGKILAKKLKKGQYLIIESTVTGIDPVKDMDCMKNEVEFFVVKKKELKNTLKKMVKKNKHLIGKDDQTGSVRIDKRMLWINEYEEDQFYQETRIEVFGNKKKIDKIFNKIEKKYGVYRIVWKKPIVI